MNDEQYFEQALQRCGVERKRQDRLDKVIGFVAGIFFSALYGAIHWLLFYAAW